ncbi:MULTISPECIES: hypothetical protein [Oxalobacteraceae]|uniref:Uncharacterized protein n=2 Tax=Oxalobacteraceae TaxID=75682 RepID=A0ABR6YMA4_9BURK|nr:MULTISPECIES: hypothetical protein [Oxalobacteraceae]MBC3884934.1 hypothetical protein [Undibacterium griseum]MBF8179467.1 hypothetical protein [Herminiimonas contaminans]
MCDAEFRHYFAKAKDAKRGGKDAWDVQSTGEKVAVALALNKPEWLASLGYTLAEAIDRTGPQWIALLPRVERALLDLE